jgi:hypothetical protein
MAAVTMLAALMGPDVLQEALERGVFHFLHDRQMLAWPTRPGYSGPSPITPIATMRSEGGDGGSSHAPASLLAASGLGGLGLSDAQRWELGRLAEKHTADYEWPPKDADPKAPSFKDQLLSDIRALKPLVLAVPELPVKLADLNKMEKRLRRPTKSLLHTNTFGIVHNNVETGWAVLETKEPIASKQLGMVHLAVAQRSLKALESVPDAVLHTEPIVESIVRVRAEAIRTATAGQMDVVLKAEDVALPTLTAAGDVPYLEILRSRDSAAAVAFREMVKRRDEDGTKTLLQEYVAALHKPTASRLDIRIARLLIGSLLGTSPVTGATSAIFDAFGLDRLLERRDAAFYVDTTLRRVANQASADEFQISVQP